MAGEYSPLFHLEPSKCLKEMKGKHKDKKISPSILDLTPKWTHDVFSSNKAQTNGQTTLPTPASLQGLETVAAPGAESSRTVISEYRFHPDSTQKAPGYPLRKKGAATCILSDVEFGANTTERGKRF